MKDDMQKVSELIGEDMLVNGSGPKTDKTPIGITSSAAAQRLNVKVGQVWVDNDSRSKTRRAVKVVEIDDMKAMVTLRNTETGRTTRVALERMRPTSTGYRLETDVE